MAAVGGFPGQDRSHELNVYLGGGSAPVVMPVPVAVGDPASAVGAAGYGGWSWGNTDSGVWLTIPGSAYGNVLLGRTPGTAWKSELRDKPKLVDTCAFVVPTPHAGVSTGMAYRILQTAQLMPQDDLEAMLAYEDQEECTGGAIADPDERLTCHTCRVWATDEHVMDELHFQRLDEAAAVILADGRERA